MKQLRKHPRIDTIGGQQRASAMKWGRMIYLGLLSVFAGSLLYYLAGDTVVLSLEGTVLRDRAAVDAAYVGKVTAVFVKEGEKVETGAPLARIESFDMVKQLADLNYRDGELAIREEQVRSRIVHVNSVKPLAERAAAESRRTVEKFDQVIDRGIVSSITRNDALRGNVDAADKLAELTVQEHTALGELNVIAAARQASAGAVEQLSRIYDEGYVRAPVKGVIGANVPLIGQVVRVGDQLMQVNGGKSYLLAYLPDQYMFSIHDGMAVEVDGGGHSVRGEVEEILAVADALPAEFQNMFRPRDRSRLVRISLPDDQPFAVTQKVTVRGCVVGLCWVK